MTESSGTKDSVIPQPHADVRVVATDEAADEASLICDRCGRTGPAVRFTLSTLGWECCATDNLSLFTHISDLRTV